LIHIGSGTIIDKEEKEAIYDKYADGLERTIREYDGILNSINEQMKSLASSQNTVKDKIKTARANSTVDYTDDIVFCQNFLQKNYNKLKRNPDSIDSKLKKWSDTRVLVMKAIVTEYLKDRPDDRVLKNLRNNVLMALEARIYNKKVGRNVL